MTLSGGRVSGHSCVQIVERLKQDCKLDCNSVYLLIEIKKEIERYTVSIIEYGQEIDINMNVLTILFISK